LQRATFRREFENAEPIACHLVAARGIGDLDPVDVQILKRSEPGRRLEPRLTNDAKHLKLAAALLASVSAGCIAVKAGRPRVFGVGPAVQLRMVPLNDGGVRT
jgi:hypothetical protein